MINFGIGYFVGTLMVLMVVYSGSKKGDKR